LVAQKLGEALVALSLFFAVAELLSCRASKLLPLLLIAVKQTDYTPNSVFQKENFLKARSFLCRRNCFRRSSGHTSALLSGKDLAVSPFALLQKLILFQGYSVISD